MPVVIILFSSVISGCQIFGDDTGASGTLTLEPHGASEMPADPTGEGPRASQASNAQIENIHWILVRLRDRAILPDIGNSQVYIRLLPQGNMMEGFGGCNRVRGHYEMGGEDIRFTSLTRTRKVCPERMEKEEAFIKALEMATKWNIAGESLELRSNSGEVLGRFEPNRGQGNKN